MSKHTWYKCPGEHDSHCIYCDGGLSSCDVCNGAEGALPTECPGRPMSNEQIDEVYAGTLDFRNGHWTTIPKLRIVR